MPVNQAILIFAAAMAALAAEPKQYKTGKLERWEILSTGSECSTTSGVLSGLSTHCGRTGVRAYHVVTDDGLDYTIQPDTWDPLKAFPLGQEIRYRIDARGSFWTPDPAHGMCPWPCTGEKRKAFMQSGDPGHEAKYLVNLIEKNKAQGSSQTLTNQDIIEMSKLGLSDAIVIQKINTSKAAFDVSVAGMKSLKDAGVADALVAAMLQRQSQ